MATNQLNKIFPTVYPQIVNKYPDQILEGVKAVLQTRGYPKDNEFFVRFKETKLYGGGDRVVKTKLILETLEEKQAHKEQVPFENLTVEHVMPQTLSSWWKQELGADWEDIHELYLHTIGNLTLTAYNSELSNYDFPSKKNRLKESHIDLNKYFSNLDRWTKDQIEKRSDALAKDALEIWKYFGQETTNNSNTNEVTGTTPTSLKILGQKFQVQSWRDVLEETLNTVADLEPEKFEIIANNFTRLVGKDRSKFRSLRELKNGYFIETHLSAQSIERFCHQALETIELTSEDWVVDIR